MLPLQDVVPTRHAPVATLILIGVNVAVFAAHVGGMPPTVVAAPFTHPGAGLFVLAVLLLWLFGDHVEARLGRVALIAVYLGAGWVTGLAATGAVTAVIGSYFVLLPQSRVLTLVPFPPWLVEVPAVFFLGVWAVLHLLQFMTMPGVAWAFVLALLIGAVTARTLRRPIQW